jgi:hypothetical protein
LLTLAGLWCAERARKGHASDGGRRGGDVLASCLSGYRIFAGSGDPPETVRVLQQALADRGFASEVDGEEPGVDLASVAMSSTHDVIGLLVAWSEGDRPAHSALTDIVYSELKGLAKAYLRHEYANQSFVATARVD